MGMDIYIELKLLGPSKQEKVANSGQILRE